MVVFSYGDVLGAGRGWASAILFNERLKAQFEAFFLKESTFALGVCNGCQMLSQLKNIIPGAAHWPEFLPNHSAQFEARLLLTQVEASDSIFLQGMVGSVMPVVVAHAEGRTDQRVTENVCLRYVDHSHRPTEHYPV